MGGKHSVAKILCPAKKKEDYARMFPLDKDFKLYDKAAVEFAEITGSKKKKMTKEQFISSQSKRFAGMEPALLDSIWNAFDSDGNGVMDVDEFRLYTAVNAVGSRRQRAIALFAVSDTSNDRSLQKNEIASSMILARKFAKKTQMGGEPSEVIQLTPDELVEVTKQADEFMARHDKDGNHVVELEEFLAGWADAAFADFNFFDDKNAPMVSQFPDKKKKEEEGKEAPKEAQEPAKKE